MNFAGFLRNVKVFDESHGSDSFFYQLAALTIQQHETLEGYEAWEAELLHPDGQSHLTQPLYDRLMELQEQRNAAIRAGEELKEKHE